MNRHFQIEIKTGSRTLAAIDDYPIAGGAITFIFGESGIGKSLLAKAVYGLLDPAALSVEINGASYQKYLKSRLLKNMKKEGFFVFQEPSSHLNPLLKLGEQLSEGSLKDAGDGQGILRHLFDTKDDTYLQSLLDIYPLPYRPSGGEKQRLLLTMAFKRLNEYLKSDIPADNSLFVFDEPSGSLDDQTRNRFIRLLINIFYRKPFTCLFITHDYSIIGEIFRHYRELLPFIRFKELVRSEAGLLMRDFAPTDYLDWLKNTRAVKDKPTQLKGQKNQNLITIRNPFRVYDHDFYFHKPDKPDEPKPFRLNRGEMVYLKAPSGLGKTTLAKIIMGLQRAQKLDMILLGKKINENTPPAFWRREIWGKKAGMVFQHADEALNLQATVGSVFDGLPLKRKLNTKDKIDLLNTLFRGEVSANFLGKRIGLLSGGQKQRLNLLPTLALDTDLIVLDEPLNGLDFASIKKIIAIIRSKQSEGKGLLLISHNEEIFDSLVSREHIYRLNVYDATS
ncbi:MAG TPA: ATP-binding cassette domain-containing protein [Caldithrix abyssi]|uniref:ATP-binding cassette domain-containing protein n=1 Tax=Caldithrix abyssi TaxID=187145 RepID=A0A7V4WVF6_CALAY|nr:ATP-binding cassette domain-containing protein [Caldithrix abyssi]